MSAGVRNRLNFRNNLIRGERRMTSMALPIIVNGRMGSTIESKGPTEATLDYFC